MPDPLSNTALAAGGTGLLTLLGALGKWLLKREVDRLDKVLDSHDKAIDALEKDHIGRADITLLGDRVENTITRAIDKMDAQFERVHTRIDQVMEK